MVKSGKRLLNAAKYPIETEANKTAIAIKLPNIPITTPVFFLSGIATASSLPFDHATVAKMAKKVKGANSSSGVETRKKEKTERAVPSRLVKKASRTEKNRLIQGMTKVPAKTETSPP